MTDSGLIVLLPLVGAIGGAWANSWYRNREAKKAQEQETKALLILIDQEMRVNAVILNSMREGTRSEAGEAGTQALA